jgi:hypothetical protein
MINNAVEQLVSELRTLPFTMIVILCLTGFSIYSFNTFATAVDFQIINKKVDRILIMQITEWLQSLQIQRCLASGENRRTLSSTIEDFQEDYRDLTGARYPIRPCD